MNRLKSKLNLCNQIKLIAMKNEKKRKRFHEKLIHVLYPPPPPDKDEEETNDKGTLILSQDGLHLNNSAEGELEEIYSGSSSSNGDEADDDDDDDDNEPKKLTRAQRKRLRRKKLKEEAHRRRKIIGPLLSNADWSDGNDDGRPEGVRRNVSVEDSNSALNKPEFGAACTIQSKVKQRRISRKLAREKQLHLMSPNQEQQGTKKPIISNKVEQSNSHQT